MYLLDTANIIEIKKFYDAIPICGVTTNPTILSKSNENILDILTKIRSIIGKDSMLHAQIISKDSINIEEEAKYLSKNINGNFYVKIPVTFDGLKAIKNLKQIGIKITATAIFSSHQALLAAEAGATFLAPYVSRIENEGADGIGTVNEISRLLEKYDCKNSKILCASFKTIKQVKESMLAGADYVTVDADIMEKIIFNSATEKSVSEFIKNWKASYNVDKLV